MKSPWLRGPLTQPRWCVEMYFRSDTETSKDKFVSLYLRKSEEEKIGKRKNPGKITKHVLFTMGTTEHLATNFRIGSAVFESSMSWGFQDLLPLSSFAEKVLKTRIQSHLEQPSSDSLPESLRA